MKVKMTTAAIVSLSARKCFTNQHAVSAWVSFQGWYSSKISKCHEQFLYSISCREERTVSISLHLHHLLPNPQNSVSWIDNCLWTAHIQVILQRCFSIEWCHTHIWLRQRCFFIVRSSRDVITFQLNQLPNPAALLLCFYCHPGFGAAVSRESTTCSMC